MAGLTTPALTVLGTVNRVRSTASSIDRATGGPGRRSRRADDRERAEDAAMLAGIQASRMRELRDDQALEAEIAAERRTAQQRLIRAEREEAERKRRAALRRTVSRTRAQLGGQGLSATDGSGEAILLGLVRESAEDAAADQRLDALRLAALDTDAETARRRNLLELTRQEERQRLERLARGLG